MAPGVIGHVLPMAAAQLIISTQAHRNVRSTRCFLFWQDGAISAIRSPRIRNRLLIGGQTCQANGVVSPMSTMEAFFVNHYPLMVAGQSKR
ncbi:hypothetical protein F4824DRAFT_462965 [Ustulina deusta]|nr:hypothetical protein F4823DRAFT_476053 [Ustulina deusta]KAI3335954.1 hypothetical protein F4824DRAFT_462965 [Ustulina deusta]